MAVQAAHINNLALPEQPKGADPKPNWQVILETIGQIALQALIPFAAAYLSYILLPASIVGVVLPIVTICTAFTISFLFAGQLGFPISRPDVPILAEAPRGIRNGAQNCWINSLAQTIRCDKGLKQWFLNLPNEWARIQQLPVLSPEILSLLSVNDEDDAVFAHFFGGEEVPDDYLREAHPKLQACIDEQTPNTIAAARSHYRKFCGDFEGSDEAFLDLILDPELANNITDLDRQKINTYFQAILEAPDATLYFRFFADIPVDERVVRWNGLAAFHLFLKAYDQAQGENLQQVQYQSQRLRVALHQLSPFLINGNALSQEDPMEAFTVIGDLLTPNELKVEVEERKVYLQGANPPIVGGGIVTHRENLQPGYLQLSISVDQPNIRDMVAQALNHKNENPEHLVRQLGEDGENHEYLVDRSERQFVTAPPSLWLHVKRMQRVTSSPWECLQRLLPNWFPRIATGTRKLDTSIVVQPEISIQPMEGDEANYRLDSFIVHRGPSFNSGHYVSYQCVEIAPGEKAWFEIDDSRVFRLSDDEAAEYSQKAYAYHYSQID